MGYISWQFQKEPSWRYQILKVAVLQKFLVRLCLQGTLYLVNNFNSLILFFAAVPTTPPTTGAAKVVCVVFSFPKIESKLIHFGVLGQF